MPRISSLSLGQPARPDANTHIEYVILQPVLNRVMAFVGCSIDDVVNNPIIKNQVIGYYKLHKTIHRRSDILDLERQWNRTGRY